LPQSLYPSTSPFVKKKEMKGEEAAINTMRIPSEKGGKKE
jgi:hypothetical protein